MSWRAPSGAGMEDKPQSLRRTVRIALAISIAIHAALVCGLLRNQPARVTSAPETIEISFDIPEPAMVVQAPQIASVASGTPNSEVVSTPVRARLAEDRGSAMAAQSRTTADRVGSMAAGVRTGVRTGEDTAEPPPASTSPGTSNGSVHGQASGWATFQPARPNLNPALGLPLADAKPRDLLAPPSGKQRTPSAPELPKVLQGGGGISASIADDGSIRFHDPKGVAWEGLSGRFDVTDQVMKLAGQDPYAAVKRKMADDTREQRLCMARRYQGERQKHELLNLSTKVRRMAARPDLSAPERRQLVFSVWDECLEESTVAGDYGAMARATIIAIIRESFPEGSELAYRPAELVAMNDQRASREPFAPYQAIASRRRPDAGVPPSETPCALP